MPTYDLGPEYPAFLQMPGRERLPFLRERRWVRFFGDERGATIISRLMDGSASISLGELVSGWSQWSLKDRSDFAYHCLWLGSQPDFPDMLRYIARNGEPEEWAGVAQSIAQHLPADEGFEVLESMLPRMSPGARGNVFQAIAIAKHPRSVAVLDAQLEALLPLPELWEDDPFVNWIACDATCAIGDLVRLGEPAAKYESLVRRLALHPCKHNVDTLRQRFGKIYAGLE